jgi:recombination protein RecT
MSNQGQQAAGAQTQAPAQRSKVDVLKSILNAPSVMEQFRNSLNENSGTFVASVIDLYNNDSYLQQCDPKAVVMEALKAAVLKLPINKSLGFAYIVPFRKQGVQQPQFQLGYKGYIQMAMRTGQYKTINADVVYEGELKKKDKLTGEIDFSGTKTGDKPVGYFAHIAMLNGFSKTLYMDVEKLTAHAKRYSKAFGNGPWQTNFDEMALKTVLRNLLSHFGFLSVEMMGAIDSDKDDSDLDDRNAAIAAGGNSKTINIEDVKFENVGGEAVDTATGEINQPTQPERGF